VAEADECGEEEEVDGHEGHGADEQGLAAHFVDEDAAEECAQDVGDAGEEDGCLDVVGGDARFLENCSRVEKHLG